ncbi:protein NO VEIN domain-containing protein [Streptomyces sp. KL2]|uniref:protein NO VEIN domain-containing protein n=1 Tax=Streptomyces sp. KL2 TaxID=3050126 RepID=UPI003978C29E
MRQSTGHYWGRILPINRWWVGDPSERYWLEITNRPDIGTNLHAPKVNDSGAEYWSYSLVQYVRPGDLVLHWDKNHGPGIVGYSRVTGEPFSSSITWQSRGTYGRQRAPSGPEPAWQAPLGGYHQLKRPLTQERLRELEPEVRKVRDTLAASIEGPVYFPFAISESRPIRAAQGYLTKWPRLLVEATPELTELRQTAASEPHEPDSPPVSDKPTPRNRSRSGYGRQQNAARRRAIERYAVSLVMSHYSSLGYETEDVGDRQSWDVTARRDETELHIEVKGSTTEREAIDLTEGEVRHAEDNATCLVVIDQIRMDSELRCSGGRWRIWEEWRPTRDVLVPTAYRYPLPSNGEVSHL